MTFHRSSLNDTHGSAGGFSVDPCLCYSVRAGHSKYKSVSPQCSDLLFIVRYGKCVKDHWLTVPSNICCFYSSGNVVVKAKRDGLYFQCEFWNHRVVQPAETV